MVDLKELISLIFAGNIGGVKTFVEKAVKDGTRSMEVVALEGTTIPHEVKGQFGAAQVVLVPAGPGTGVIAGKKLVPLLELVGIHNVLTKAYGSTSPKNLLKAGMNALKQLRTAEIISELRGVKLT